jgi:hypothetical protein
LTVDCTGLETEDALAQTDAVVHDLPDGAHVRILAGENDPIAASLNVLQGKYPQFSWTSKRHAKAKSGKDVLQDMRAKFQAKPITDRTIGPMIKERLETMACDESTIARCLRALDEVV